MNDPETPSPDVSVVIPALDEENTIEPLAEQIGSVLEALGKDYEIVFVDDGSTDGTFERVRVLHERDGRIKGIRFRGNFGKSEALTAGFDASRGKVIVTMDADLQDDPEEIPRFLETIQQGYDLVSGWKKQRQDPLGKRIPSLIFNRITSWVSGIKLHDFNCGFKAYRRELVEELDIYGELHRYIPALAGQRRFRIAEIPVRHHPRRHGRSKYGWERFTRGLLDLITILFLTNYLRRPAHLFGTTGLALGGTGFLICMYMTVLWFLGQRPIGNRPLLLLGILLLITGVQFVSIGLLGELINRFNSSGKPEYSVIEELR